MKRFGKFVLFLGLLPSVGYAHGEQVFALPVAQAGVLIILGVAVFFLKMRPVGRILFFLLPIAAMVATWLIPGKVVASVQQRYDYGYSPFLFLGAVPPLFVAAAVLRVFHSYHGKEKQPNEASEKTAPHDDA